MKPHTKRMRVLRGLTVAACAFGLAASGAASAKPLPPDPPFTTLQPATTLHPHSRPVLTPSAYVLPASFKTDVQSSPHAAAPVQPPVAVAREIRTVTDHGDRTLSLVLAAAALGIALCGTGYAAVRLANLQRRVAGSSS